MRLPWGRGRDGRTAPPAPGGVGGAGGPGYVCFAAQDWWYHNRAHSDFQLMRHVAPSRPVLVVNSIGMRMPRPGRASHPLRRILRKVRSMAKLLRRPAPGFWVLSPVVLPFYGIPPLRPVNAGLVRAQVALAARRAGIRRPVVVVTIPTAWPVVRRMRHGTLVFNRSDKHSAFAGVDAAYIRSLEEALLGSADHVLYASRRLLEEERALTGERGRQLDHGVDLDRFRLDGTGLEPADLRTIPHPRAGFFGDLDPHLVDFDLLEHLARELPEIHVVLIGTTSGPVEALTCLPNVHWLGFRPYEEVPRYGAGFDVGLMPWVRSDWIRYCNPIKLKEYLALGLPVVSTEFDEVHRYAHVVRVATGPDDFVRHVRLALAEHGRDRAVRRAAVAGDSWAARAAELMDLCERRPPTAGSTP